MPNKHSLFELHRTDARITIRLERVEVVCVAGAVVIAAASLATKLLPGLRGSSLRWTEMPLACAVAALACSVGLALASEEGSAKAAWSRRALGLLTALAGLAAAFWPKLTAAGALNALQVTPSRSMSLLIAIAFGSLGIVVLCAHAGRGSRGWIPDGALFGAGWVVLTLVMGAAFGALHTFGDAPPGQVTPATTATLLLLTLAAVGRRVEYGRWSIFIGRGIGSRMARAILPIVLLLPMARELMRARMMRTHLFAAHYASAILAATGTAVALALLLAVSWQFRRLEWKVQSLSLRDELTGLYNLRGFHLLAEQGLRMARRSRVPFSVLFIDVDNLKKINDQYGHSAGSDLLVEAAGFLKMNFRETDILGRIGGDEFAVAGQFGVELIERAEERLKAGSNNRNAGDGPPLSLSIGHVSADLKRTESLEDLLQRADALMYERKRMKKLQAV
ncbi:GGDEF domain-containing protein [Occallatibacter riparius]|uniref:diguanylate cyclase n=1 Tax=Occallatibacter riparius TaxID=1002689 RepID=A0A9J7BLQ3_9BACT|nr:GGDEF domain-containing protein [Occallatibacter riparius]UWZ83575.1 GGDEF domain-containing protein [Occallatibacter riparius]